MDGAGGLFTSNGFCALARGGVAVEESEGVANGLSELVGASVGGGSAAMRLSRLTRLAFSPRNDFSTDG